MKAYNWINTTIPDISGWEVRHRRAIEGNHPVAQAMRAWCSYAETHREKFGSNIGDDYVLGPAWAQWGFALRALLNGDCGSLDCGTLDTILHDNLSDQGWDPDTEQKKAR